VLISLETMNALAVRIADQRPCTFVAGVRT
jgi:hypothetical protein